MSWMTGIGAWHRTDHYPNTKTGYQLNPNHERVHNRYMSCIILFSFYSHASFPYLRSSLSYSFHDLHFVLFDLLSRSLSQWWSVFVPFPSPCVPLFWNPFSPPHFAIPHLTLHIVYPKLYCN